MSLLGSTELIAKLEKMNPKVEVAITRQMNRECVAIQSIARANTIVNNGELRRSIRTTVEKTSNKITGKVFTTAPYAMYVEFGTGPKGEAEHGGISPHVMPTYISDPWFIHQSMIDPKDALRYGWKEWKIGGEIFYRTYGQVAQPFLYPAYKTKEKQAKENINKAIKVALAEVCND